MAWTNPRTWVATEKPPAATLNTHIRDNLLALFGTNVSKSADESVTSSTALQNDNHLFCTIANTGTYVVDLYLYATSAADAAGDMVVGFSFPTGTLHFDAVGLDASLASGSTGTSVGLGRLSATSGTTSINVGLSTSVLSIHMHGILGATATGTLQFMWAQLASNANASTVKAGSHMLVRQVA